MNALSHLRVWEHQTSPAVGLAGRLFSEMGASVELIEPRGGSPLRRLPPFVGGSSTLFEYLAAGKQQRCVVDVDPYELARVNLLLVGDEAAPESWQEALKVTTVPDAGRAALRCTPYGLTGPKSSWRGSELSLFQAGGEGYVTPSGLSFEEFPDRAPLGAARYVGSYQAGLTAALGALAALRLSRATARTEHIDVAIQDAQLSLNYMVLSRYVDGTLEQRANRAFVYGGILRCSDGYVEVVPIEEHQWDAVRGMLGDPAWAREERFGDGISRGRCGNEINAHLRRWAAERTTKEVIAVANKHDVPCGAFVAPEDLPTSPQFVSRAFFRPASAGTGSANYTLGSPWHIETDGSDD